MKKLIAFSSIVVCFLLAGSVQSFDSPGEPIGHVSDFAGVLSDEADAEIESSLSLFALAESNEIAVATISSLEDETIETYAVKLFEEWGIGRQKEDNGVLLLIAPNERKVRIEVGYGLEGALTDLESSQIIRNILTPAFRENDFDNGIKQAVAAIMQATEGEYVFDAGETTADEYDEMEAPPYMMQWVVVGVILLIIIIMVIVGFVSKRGGGKGGTGGSSGSSGSTYKSSSKSSSSSSSSSSSFGGFSGGSSGGGGASGSW